jgi:FAD/FMN-containing dehydrogenase
MTTALDELAQAIGAAHVLTAPQDMAPYQTGARYDQGRALAVLRPADTHQVAACLQLAARHDLHIIPQGANTGLVAGATPDSSGAQIVLSLARLKTCVIDADNGSARVGAGLLLSDLNAQAARQGLCFPIDLGADPSIGGMIATNTGGARFLRHGDVRANVLGLVAVLPGGQVVQMGKGLRKDNTGPDWKHLLIGTSGAFGIVTEAELRLSPVPQDRAVALIAPADPNDIPRLFRAAEAVFGDLMTAFEGMSDAAINAAVAHVPALRQPFAPDRLPPYTVLIELSQSRARLDGEATMDDLLQNGLTRLIADQPELIADARFGRSDDFWALRHALSDGVKAAGRLIAFDLGFRRGDVMRFRAKMRNQLAQDWPMVQICDFGHIGDGGLHFNLVLPKDSPAASDPLAEAALRDLVIGVAVAEFGASFSAEHAIGRRNQGYYTRYTDPALRQMAAALHGVCPAPRLGAARFD